MQAPPPPQKKTTNKQKTLNLVLAINKHLNPSEARFMKSFKALFQKLTDLACIILRLFPSG